MRKIVIDSYGADKGDEIIVRGAFEALKSYDEFGAVIAGNRRIFEKCLAESGIEHSRVELMETDDAIKNNDPPICIFNDRNNSSMALSLDRLKKDDDCFACLSPGNTGALFVGSICRLGMVDGLKSPVLSSALPTPSGGWVCLLDCGARMSCKALDFVKFGELGSEFARLAFGVKTPRIGLLSVGREKEKGNDLTKEAYDLLAKSDLNFAGNIEGYDLLTDYVDVVVADGFSGNLLLKNVEATGKAAMQIVSDLRSELGEENNPIFDRIQNALSMKFDLNMRGGATFLGTVKPIIKMHGCSTEETVKACIDQLIRVERASDKNK